MKKIIRLTESDLARIVRRVIKENEENEFIGETINLYRNKNERQQDFAYNVKIASVDVNGNDIMVGLDGGTQLTLKCTDSTGAFSMGSAMMYNRSFYRDLKATYCMQRRERDRKKDLSTVPTATYASTGGQMGNMG